MLRAIFMPPYNHNTVWPEVAQYASYIAAIIALLLWLVPGARREARITSLAFLGGMYYLMNFVGFPMPWYLPTVTTLSFLTLAITGGQLAAWAKSSVAATGKQKISPGVNPSIHDLCCRAHHHRRHGGLPTQMATATH